MTNSQIGKNRINRMAGSTIPAQPACDSEKDIEAISALFELPAGPWRSLGQHLDYTDWPDRERFIALDHAIRSEPRWTA